MTKYGFMSESTQQSLPRQVSRKHKTQQYLEHQTRNEHFKNSYLIIIQNQAAQFKAWFCRLLQHLTEKWSVPTIGPKTCTPTSKKST